MITRKHKSKSRSRATTQRSRRGHKRSKSVKSHLGKSLGEEVEILTDHNGKKVGEIYKSFVDVMLSIENVFRLATNGGKDITNANLTTLKNAASEYEKIAKPGRSPSVANKISLMTRTELKKNMAKLFSSSSIKTIGNRGAGRVHVSRGGADERSRNIRSRRRRNSSSPTSAEIDKIVADHKRKKRQESVVKCSWLQTAQGIVFGLTLIYGVNWLSKGWLRLAAQNLMGVAGAGGEAVGEDLFWLTEASIASIKQRDSFFFDTVYSKMGIFWKTIGCDAAAQWCSHQFVGTDADHQGALPFNFLKKLVFTIARKYCSLFMRELPCGRRGSRNISLRESGSNHIAAAHMNEEGIADEASRKALIQTMRRDIQHMESLIAQYERAERSRDASSDESNQDFNGAPGAQEMRRSSSSASSKKKK